MSGAVLTESGYSWVGCDISADMLSLAQGDAEVLSNPSAGNFSKPSAPLLASRTGYNKLNHNHVGPQEARSQPSAGKGLVFHSDMAQGLPLKAGSIDGAVSISAVQWLCHLPNPKLALGRLFRALYRCLKPECRAVLQVYLTGLVKQSSSLTLSCENSAVMTNYTKFRGPYSQVLLNSLHAVCMQHHFGLQQGSI